MQTRSAVSYDFPTIFLLNFCRPLCARKFLKSVLEPSSCLFALLLTSTGSLYHNSTKDVQTSSLAPPPVPENTRHSSPMLCPIINLRSHKLFVCFCLILYTVCVPYRHYLFIYCYFVTQLKFNNQLCGQSGRIAM